MSATAAALTPSSTYRSGHCQIDRHSACAGDYSAIGGARCTCACHPTEPLELPATPPVLYHQSTDGIRDALPTPVDVAAHPETTHLHLMWLCEEVDRLAAEQVATLTQAAGGAAKGGVRRTLIGLLIAHQRLDTGPPGCLCGWNEWGGSYAAHLADILGPAIHAAAALERAGGA